MTLRKMVLMLLAVVLVGAMNFGCAKKQVETTAGSAPGYETSSSVTVETDSTSLEEQLKADKAMQMAVATVEERIFFAFDSSELTSESKSVLDAKAKVLNNNTKLKVLIAGNTDERGTEEYNMALGQRRAQAAYDYLVLMGVNSGNLQTVSYGEERPLDPAPTEAAWAKNRRDDFFVTR